VTMRPLVLMVAVASLLLNVVHGQRPVTEPELLAGPWEMTTPSGAHGILLRISTHARGPGNRQTITNQTITVRVYHRKDGQETWGWYGDNGSVSSVFDGERLRVVGLDATFHSDRQRWSGTWSLDGTMRDVVLERPRPEPGSKPVRLCGDREGLADTRPGTASSRFHVVQSSDATLTAWMDRMIAIEDQRHGELLRIVSADPLNLILDLDSAIGPQYRFTGVLAGDGSVISGRWNGLNASGSFRRIQ